jgi:predicted naringenin-chalcone synthase
MVTASIAGLGSAWPQTATQEEAWETFFRFHYDDSPLARKIFRKTQIQYRHSTIDPRVQREIPEWGTARRMQRFVEDAMPLGREALTMAFDSAGLTARDVGLLAVVTCTGYATPGLDVKLAEQLGMSPSTQRLHIGHMGCYAAIPGLAAVQDAAVARGKVAAMLCVELTSLHVQPATDEVEQMVAHALFSDGAAAVAVVPDSPGLEVVDIVARTASEYAEMMTWDVTDQGFRMGLSPAVPAVLGEHVVDVVDELLATNGLRKGDVARWAVHPGGPTIVDVVAERLELEPAELDDSRETLRMHGNCSSATILLILERVLSHDDLDAGDHVVAMAFGPGLTLYAALLRKRR